MQFSKRVSELARLHGVDQKDVLFAMLATAGASVSEAFAVIYHPAASTSAALSTRASNYIGQRPGLRRLIDYLDEGRQKKGRPRKNADEELKEDVSKLDYNNKDAVLQELARIAERSDKESDKLAALREISNLQRMKLETSIESEKRVVFYIPLTFDKCRELLDKLDWYYAKWLAGEVFNGQNAG